MANYIGSVQEVDHYIGNNLIVSKYIGETKYFDAYTEINGNLPFSFKSRAEHNLKNYTVYGTANGAGVETENLFNVSDFISNYVAGYAKDGSGNIVESLEGSSGYSTYTIPVNQNQIYYLRGKTRPDPSSYGGFRLYFLDSNLGWIGRTENINQYDETGVYKFTTPANTSYLQVQNPVAMATPNMRLMITSNAPTTYVPYGYQIPITNTSGVTENLFDKDATDTNNGYVNNAYLTELGSVTTDSGFCISEYMSVEAEENYTLNAPGLSSMTNASLCFYDSNKSFISGEKYNNRAPITFSSPANSMFARITVHKSLISSYVFVKGSTAPSKYIPHRYETTYNLYIGESKLEENDLLYFSEQKIFKNTITTVFNGTEDWRYYGKYGGHNTFYYDYGTDIQKKFVFLFCNKYATTEDVSLEGTRNNTIRYQNQYAGQYWNINRIYIFDDRFNNLNDFKDYLQSLYSSGVPLIVTSQTETSESKEPPISFPAITTYKDENTLSSSETVGEVTVSGRIRPYIYGWHVDPSISDPAQAITYLGDAVGKTPAAMGSSTFSYGDWQDVFFMPKPCMVKSNGTVDYYLNPNDYTKKIDGTASDVANVGYDGNAMVEWPLIWWKYEAGETEGEGYFYVSDVKVDDTYHCWCNINCDNEIVEHFYTAIYNGTGTDKLRSISGVALTSANGNGGTTYSEESIRALANNTTAKTEWFLDVWSDRMLINSLLILMGKSLNSQATFGRGLDAGGQTAKEAYVTGTLNDKGLFWGNISTGTSSVKVFGMENWWGCVWSRTAGLIGLANGNTAYKMTYGTADGTTANGYNTTGDGYHINTVTRPVNGYVKSCKFGDFGYLPLTTDGSASTYYANYWYTSNSTLTFAVVGGNSNGGAGDGVSFFDLAHAENFSHWGFATALSLKPLEK